MTSLFLSSGRLRRCVIVAVVVILPSVGWSRAYDRAESADVANAVEHDATGFADSISARSTGKPSRIFSSGAFFVTFTPATPSADFVIACFFVVEVPRRYDCARAEAAAHLLNVKTAALSRAQEKHAFNSRFVEAF